MSKMINDEDDINDNEGKAVSDINIMAYRNI